MYNYNNGAGSEAGARATAVALARSTANANDSMAMAGQYHLQRKRLQAEQDGRMAEIGFKREQNEADRIYQTQRDQAGYAATAARDQAGYAHTGELAKHAREQQDKQFTTTESRLSAGQQAQLQHSMRVADIQEKFNSGQLSISEKNLAITQANADRAAKLDAAREGRDTERFANEQDDRRDNPARIFNKMEADALRGVMPQGGPAPSAPPTQYAPSAPRTLDDAPSVAVADNSRQGGGGLAALINPMIQGPRPSPLRPEAAPAEGGLGGQGGEGFMQQMLRRRLGMKSPEDASYESKKRDLEMKTLTANFDDAQRKARGELSAPEKTARDTQEVSVATRDAQQYMMQYKIPAAEAAKRALAPINAVRARRGEAPLSEADINVMDAPVNVQPQALAAKATQLGAGTPDQAFEGALLKLVQNDPSQQGWFGRKLKSVQEGFIGQDAPINNRDYQVLNKAKLTHELISAGWDPREAARIVAGRLGQTAAQ